MNIIHTALKNTMKRVCISTRAKHFAFGLLIIGGAAFFPGGEVQAAGQIYDQSPVIVGATAGGNGTTDTAYWAGGFDVSGANGNRGWIWKAQVDDDFNNVCFWFGTTDGVSGDLELQINVYTRGANFPTGGSNTFLSSSDTYNAIILPLAIVPNGGSTDSFAALGAQIHCVEFATSITGYAVDDALVFAINMTNSDSNVIMIGGAGVANPSNAPTYMVNTGNIGNTGTWSGSAAPFELWDGPPPPAGDPEFGIISTFPETGSATSTDANITFETTIKLKQEWIDAAMVNGAGACSNSNYPNAGHCGEFRVFWESIRNIDHPTAAINATLEEELVRGSFWGTTIATTTAEQTFSWGPYELPDGTYAATVKITSNKGFGAPVDTQQVIFRVGTSKWAIGSTLEEVLDGTASSSPSGNVLMDNIITPVVDGIKYKFPWGFYFLVKEEIELGEEGALGNFAITFPEENAFFGGMTLTIVDWEHVGDMLDTNILSAINIAFGTIVWAVWVWWGVNFGRRVMGTLGGGDGGMSDMNHKMN